jgi:two-component system response regulator DegU
LFTKRSYPKTTNRAETNHKFNDDENLWLSGLNYHSPCSSKERICTDNDLKIQKSKNTSIKIVLASSSKLFLEGVKRILDSQKELQIVVEISGLQDVEKKVIETRPEFVFIDDRTADPDIEKRLKLIIGKCAHTRIILMGNRIAPHFGLNRIIRVSTETGSAGLISIIKECRVGERPSLTESENRPGPTLTKTESKIVELIVDGFSNREIGNELSISDKTVKAHLSSIFAKLKFKSRYQLMSYALKIQRLN